MANSADIAALQQERSDLIALRAAETRAQLTGGPKPTYSLDGVSYQWNEWREMISRQIMALTEEIRTLSQPWIVRTRTKA